MTVFLEYDMEDGEWVIMVRDGAMRAMPAGPRIFRAPPHPRVRFKHETKHAAELDAGLIREYFANLKLGKSPTKKELREFQA